MVLEVTNGATSVEISEAGGGPVTSYPVGPDGRARVPVTWGGGSLLFVTTGKWPGVQVLLVEVISTLR